VEKENLLHKKTSPKLDVVDLPLTNRQLKKLYALIKRNHHLLWLDKPNKPAFFEEDERRKELVQPGRIEEKERLKWRETWMAVSEGFE
jgi:hypothetical protein